MEKHSIYISNRDALNSSCKNMLFCITWAARAKFSDAFWIIFLGIVIGALLNVVFGEVFVGISAMIIDFII